MDPFISIYELIDVTERMLIYCNDEGSSVMYSIPESVVFTVPSTSQCLIEKIQRLSLGETKKIICYDKGDLIPAGKVYWALRAAGFENVFIMLGGVYLYNDLGYRISTDQIDEIPLEEQNYLPFNNSILQIADGAPKKSSYFQIIRTDEDIPITTPRGQILPKETLLEVIANHGIKYKAGKPIQFYGKFAIIAACLFLHLGHTHVSVVLDKKEQVYLTRTNRSLMQTDSESAKAYSVHENTHYDSTQLSPIVPRMSSTRKAGTVCGNCIVI